MNTAEQELHDIATAVTEVVDDPMEQARQLVEAGFTLGQVQEWVKAWGSSGDFSAKSLVRMNSRGLSPEVAGVIAMAGPISANEALLLYTQVKTQYRS